MEGEQVRSIRKIKTPESGEIALTVTAGHLRLVVQYDHESHVIVTSRQSQPQIEVGAESEIELTSVPGCIVTGRLVFKNQDGIKEVGGAGLLITTENETNRIPYVFTATNGRFSVCVPFDKITLRKTIFTPMGILWLEQPVHREISAHEALVDLGDIAVSHPMILSGHVKDRSGTPLPFAMVACLQDTRVKGSGRANALGEFQALCQSIDIDEFSITPNRANFRVTVDVLEARPLQLQADYP